MSIYKALDSFIIKNLCLMIVIYEFVQWFCKCILSPYNISYSKVLRLRMSHNGHAVIVLMTMVCLKRASVWIMCYDDTGKVDLVFVTIGVKFYGCG